MVLLVWRFCWRVHASLLYGLCFGFFILPGAFAFIFLFIFLLFGGCHLFQHFVLPFFIRSCISMNDIIFVLSNSAYKMSFISDKKKAHHIHKLMHVHTQAWRTFFFLKDTCWFAETIGVWQLRSEGKDYIVQEGDVMLFRFNVWPQYCFSLLYPIKLVDNSGYSSFYMMVLEIPDEWDCLRWKGLCWPQNSKVFFHFYVQREVRNFACWGNTLTDVNPVGYIFVKLSNFNRKLN